MRRFTLTVITLLSTACGFLAFSLWISDQLAGFASQEAFSILETTQNQETAADVLEFPFLIEGTTLIAESLASYEGWMLERDSEEFLVDAAALELHNYGLQEILFAEVMLSVGGEELLFYASNILPGATVLVVEYGGQKWMRGPCTGSKGEAAYELQPISELLHISEVGMATLAITNPTEEPLHDILIYYKNYLPENDLYIGGVTYLEQIDMIGSGETVLITPYRYVSGYSRVVKTQVLG